MSLRASEGSEAIFLSSQGLLRAWFRYGREERSPYSTNNPRNDTHEFKKTRNFSVSFGLFLTHLVSIDQSSLPRIDGNLRSVCEMQFTQNVTHMTFHSVFTDD